MVERTGRTVICSIVFMDIIGFSKSPVASQMVMKDRLNSLIRRAVIDIAEAERIVIDTGDGVAICFTGDPEDAVFVATAVNDAIRKSGSEVAMTLRIGINLGPVKTVIDLNGQQNVIGDGINVAERVMSFAGENEILISRSYYEVVARLNERYASLFHYIGMKKDKHIREHQIYALGSLTAKALEAQLPAAEVVLLPSDAPAQSLPDDPEAIPVPEPGPDPAFAAEWLAAEEQRLTDLIGPLAKVVVARAAQSTDDTRAFYETIASVIPDDADRASFLAAAPGTAETPLEPAVENSPEPDVDAAAAPATEESTAPTKLQLAEIERHLTGHLGPLAAVLVRKAVQRATSLDDLCAELAAHIKDERVRQIFLSAFRQ